MMNYSFHLSDVEIHINSEALLSRQAESQLCTADGVIQTQIRACRDCIEHSAGLVFRTDKGSRALWGLCANYIVWLDKYGLWVFKCPSLDLTSQQ